MISIRIEQFRALRELVKLFCARAGITKANEESAVKSISSRLQNDSSVARVYREIKTDLRMRIAA